MAKYLAPILSVICFILGIISIYAALTAFMLFDAPGSDNNNFLWVVFWSALALPIVCFISAIASMYVSFRRKNYKLALWILTLPLIDIAIIIISMVLIQYFCHGNFSC